MKLALLLALIFMLCVFPASKAESQGQINLQTYIVHVKKPADVASLQSEELHSWYQSFLPTETSKKDRMVFSYRNVASGFAVKLTAEEAKALREKDEIVSARPERILSLHTTHSPSFLGLNKVSGVWKDSNFGEGVIVGVVDTGIYPFHPSFSDEGMPPPPAKWKGHCDFTGQRTCNNKLIGARNLLKSTDGGELPFENIFHGSHTAAEAAGTFVEDASVFGNAKGTASGIAPKVHVAMYRVCDDKVGCSESAVLAAMDIAVEDGVDVLSLSLGLGSLPFYEDPIALGAFTATQKGIFVSCSAANSGPDYSSLSNEAPWILTVGASTIDRTIKATAKLGNGAEYDGQSLAQPSNFSSTLLPLVYPGANGNQSSVFCAAGSLDNVDVKDKVVLCELGGIPRTIKGQVVKDAGGAAMIVMNPELAGFSTFSDAQVLPATHVSYAAGLAIKEYINSTNTPTATILFKGTVIGDALAPAVVFFSSRGPSLESPGILKPDIIGPGVNILAAWPISVDNKIPSYNIVSGTSMSCPHLSGIAALLKSAHPEWSPAAIKSAIMTTAYTVNLAGKPILDEGLLPADIFATGAGHVNPNKANDPGLVYDIHPDDYIPYLCGLNYTDREVGIIVQERVNCSEVKSIPEAQLNYPSISILLGSTSQYYTRTLTNVGPVNTTYSVEIEVPLAVGMSVNPRLITFTEMYQKATYSVEFIPESKENRGNHSFAQGSLSWVSKTHTVRIPISVIFL